ncbi:ABC transporter substrate-binding protein [Priestia megaterium]|nr:ABC transporter substrate-binding protein [Priestia megaterium]
MNMRKRNNYLLLSLCLMVAIVLGACSKAAEPAETNETSSKDNGLVIENRGNTFTYNEAPKRAVALNQHATEIMLALGLEDSMVGTAYLDDKILPKYKDAYEGIPVLSKQYPSKEVFLQQEPDFAYAGWKSAFTEKTLGTVEDLQELEINTYIQESSNISGPTLDDVYKDIENIGKIFHVENKAEEVIQTMKADINKTIEKVGPIDKKQPVFVYDSGQETPFTAANNYLTHLIAIAGGKNIFDDIDKGWAEVSWEEVVNRNPEVIVIIDYGAETVEQKKEFLLSKQELADVSAIKNERFIVLPLSAGAEGIRAPMSLQTLAEGFYPDKFKK